MVPTPGQSNTMRSGSRVTLAIPDVGTTRTVVARLLPNGNQGRKLLKLADLSARLYNEVNYERRRQFFKGGNVDFKGTWIKYYGKYRDRLGVNAQAILQKNNEAWSSFFTLLKLKKEGTLPPHIHRVSPPRYWKEMGGRRKLILVVRQDRYEVNVERKVLILKDFKLEIPFTGSVRWYGKQGRLEIVYDEVGNKWYAHIPVEVGVENAKTGKTSKFIVKGERKSIQIHAPRGNHVASIDLGINILASVVMDDGTWLLYRGTRVKEDYFYFQKRIAEVQSLADRVKNMADGSPP